MRTNDECELRVRPYLRMIFDRMRLCEGGLVDSVHCEGGLISWVDRVGR